MADKTLQAIIKLRDEFSDKMKQVKQVTDSAKDAMKIANDTSKTYGDSMKTTGKAIDEVSKASNSTQSSTNGMNQSFSNTNGAVQKMSDSLKAYSEKMKESALSMTAFGTAVLGLGKKAYKSYGEVKAGLNEVYIATGATGDGAKGLEKSFKNIASTSFETFEAIGGTLGEVNTRFGYTSTEAEKCTKQFIKFAKVNKIDAVRAVQLVSRAMGDAGVDTKEYSSTMDKLTTMAQASGISMEELATTLVQYGAPMRNLGLSFDESIALLGKWQLEGVNTTTALAGMKIAIGKWSSEGKNATKEFSKTVEAIKSCKDPAEATGMAIEAFGQRAGPDLVDAIRGGKFDYQKYVEMIKNSGGTVDNTAKQIATAGDSIKTIMNSVKLLWGEFGAEINSVFAPAMKIAAEQISKVTKWFMDLSPEAKDVISTIAGVVLAFGAYNFVVGSAMLFTGKIVPLLGKLGFTLKFLTSPTSLVALGIIALGGACIYAYKHSKSFKKEVDKIIKKLKNFKQTIKDNEDAIKKVAIVLGTIFGPALIKIGVEAVIAGAKLTGKFVFGMMEVAGQAAITSVTLTTKFIASIIKSGAEAVIAGWKFVGKFVFGLISIASNAIITGTAIAVNLIANFIKVGIQAAITAGIFVGKFVFALMQIAGQAVITGITIAVSLVSSLIKFVAQGALVIASITLQVIAFVSQKIAMISSAVAMGVVTAAQWALNAAMSANPIALVIIAIAGLVAGFVTLYKKSETVRTIVNKAFNAIKTTITNVAKAVKEKIDGIKDWWQGLIDKVRNNPLTATIKTVEKIITGGNGKDDGRNAYGLREVKRDNEVHRLHQGEMVLTKQEANRYRNGQNSGSFNIAKLADTIIVREDADIEKIADALVRKIHMARLGGV